MSRFKDQLLEMGTFAQEFPEGELVFRVPLASLQPSLDSEAPLIKGTWTASVEVRGSVEESAVGGSGEHAMEWLVQAMRRRKRS